MIVFSLSVRFAPIIEVRGRRGRAAFVDAPIKSLGKPITFLSGQMRTPSGMGVTQHVRKCCNRCGRRTSRGIPMCSRCRNPHRKVDNISLSYRSPPRSASVVTMPIMFCRYLNISDCRFVTAVNDEPVRDVHCFSLVQ